MIAAQVSCFSRIRSKKKGEHLNVDFCERNTINAQLDAGSFTELNHIVIEFRSFEVRAREVKVRDVMLQAKRKDFMNAAIRADII
jgi:hypothetical protein